MACVKVAGSSVHRRSRYKCFIQDRKQKSLSPRESFTRHSESYSDWSSTSLCPGFCWGSLEKVFFIKNTKDSFTLVLNSFLPVVTDGLAKLYWFHFLEYHDWTGQVGERIPEGPIRADAAICFNCFEHRVWRIHLLSHTHSSKSDFKV